MELYFCFFFFLQLKEQAKESESTRRKLERARQEVFQHMTKIRNEKENLEREVNSLNWHEFD